MPRYIDADAFFADFSEIRDYEYASQEYEVDVVERKHGEWKWENRAIVGKDGVARSGIFRFRCSECGDLSTSDSQFCPNCGADMREETEDAVH